MSTDLSTPVLLRRIAQLEATVGRLSEDLGTLRSAVSKQGLQLPRTRGVRARVAHADSSAAVNLHAQATGGLAGCIVPYCRKDFIYDESLLLRGMERIYRLNCKQ